MMTESAERQAPYREGLEESDPRKRADTFQQLAPPPHVVGTFGNTATIAGLLGLGASMLVVMLCFCAGAIFVAYQVVGAGIPGDGPREPAVQR